MNTTSDLSLILQKVSQMCFLLLSWLTVSQALPAILRSIGVYVFGSPPPLMLPLGALLLLTVVIAGLARSSLSISIHERRVFAGLFRCHLGIAPVSHTQFYGRLGAAFSER